MWPVLKSRSNCLCAVTKLNAVNIGWVRNSSTNAIPSNLFLSPREWKGLPPTTILQLHEERKFKLGPNYQPNVDELDALYATKDFTGLTVNQIKQDYQSYWVKNNVTKGDKQQQAKIKKYNAFELKHGLRPFQFDDLPTAVQEDLDDIKETRYYQRIAAFELPQLVKFRQEYKPVDTKQNPITYKYTTYMGEEHPNSKKVVLSCQAKDLDLDAKQLHKFKLLARTRYNFETDQFKMSSEKFNEPLQNAHYLHDIFQRLINESKDLSIETFEDIPLDTRHIKAQNLRKKKHGKTYNFPEEWSRPEDAPEEKINVLKDVFN